MRIATVDITAQVDGSVQGTACLLGQGRGFIARGIPKTMDQIVDQGDRRHIGKGDPPSLRSNCVPAQAIANKELSLSQPPLSCAPYA
jgi:hypothetical protein